MIAIALKLVKGSLMQMFISILSAMSGPIIAVFFLSIFFKKATSAGTLIGGCLGLLVALWFSFGYNFSTTLPKTPWLPLGPTDGCPASLLNQTDISIIAAQNMTTESNINLNESPKEAVGLDKVFSLSYQYFCTLSILMTVLSGLLISYLRPSDYQVPADRLFSIRSCICCVRLP